LTSAEWQRRGFLEDDVTALFSTNQEVNKENALRLVKLGNPIARIEAMNSCWDAKKLSPDRFYGLKNLTFLAVGASVVLETNLCPELGLANGSTGLIRDIVYRTNELPPTKCSKVLLGQNGCLRGSNFLS
jgi:hypothetical protein